VVYRFGPFEVDDRLFELRRDGVVVPLQRRAFDLLHHLLERRGVVVSKEELRAQVWAGAAVTEVSFTRAVMAVRSALGDTAETPRFVHTVRGRGYRFVPDVKTLDETPPSAPDSWR
jgi:DNA-binding winged helix-turn-helix (wHTH) protein